jgi:hypothetical protein
VKETGSSYSRKIVIDLLDRSDCFVAPRLEQCDFYFKRSYFQEDVNLLPRNLIEKVIPFGLTFKCRGNHDKATIKRALGYYFSNHFSERKPLSNAKHFRYTIGLLRAIYASPTITEFENTPDTPMNLSVFFQTRVWPLNTSTDNIQQVNQERVAIVRALKNAFGTQFIGGLTNIKQAIKEYPDCLSLLKTDQRSFIKTGKSCLIGVYTRGLHNSMALKLPEYLAAAKCIVSEPLRNELPTPLEPGKNYLEFRSPEECVAACKRLLNDSQLASQMRHNNYYYYNEEIKPSVRMLKCLMRSLRSS